MGGGGYKPSGSRKLGEVERLFEQTRQREQQIRVSEVIDEVLKEINQIDTEVLNRHKRTILEALKDHFEGVYDLRGGGSYTRRTYVNGLSDVDVLLDLGEYTNSDIPDKDDPQALLREMVKRLRQRLPETDITYGKMAVTVGFSDGLTIQVLPAFRVGQAYRIPDPDGNGWTTTRPQVFARMLTRRNQELSGNLIPCIKLAKLICSNRGLEISSYHIENMALRAFEDYSGSKTIPAMLNHFFDRAKVLVLSPMRDVTGQTDYVDSYLETQDARRTLHRQLRQVESAILAANDNPDQWRSLLRGK